MPYNMTARPNTPAAAAPAAIITPVGWLAAPPLLCDDTGELCEAVVEPWEAEPELGEAVVEP